MGPELFIHISRFSRTCFLDSDGEVTCGNCPEGYIGRRCERCAEGYVGDPMIPGSSCRKTVGEKFEYKIRHRFMKQ